MLFQGSQARERDQGLIGDYESERQALEAADGPRTGRMRLYRDELELHRSVDDLGRSSMSDYGRGRVHVAGQPDKPSRHDVRLPYALAQTIKHAYRTAGRLPDITVDRADGSAKEVHRQSQLEKMLWHSYRESGARTTLADCAWDGSLLGASVLEVFYDFKKMVPAFRVLEPASVHVVPGHADPHDFQRFYRSWLAPKASVIAEYRDRHIDRASPDMGVVDVGALSGGDHVGGVELLTIHEMKDQERCFRWCGQVALHREDTRYGFCPVVVVPNVGPGRMVWGYSDYELVRNVAFYYQTFLSRQADVIRFVSNGVYVAARTGLQAEQVRSIIMTGGVIPVKEDGRVEPVQAPDQPAFVEQHAMAMEQALFDLGFTSPASWGRAGSVSSGTERQMQMQPESELAQLKQAAFATGLERLNSMLLQLWERKTVGRQSYRGSISQGGRQRRYLLELGAPAVEAGAALAPDDPSIMDPDLAPQAAEQLPQTAKELIAGDYQSTVGFQRHLDVHDPNFILAEVNKFSAGIQSLKTTLENLGVQAAEDEIQLIQQEAEAMPWLRQGAMKLIELQIQQMEAAGGAAAGGAQGMSGPPDGAAEAAMGALGSGASGMGFDALSTALNGNSETGRAEGAPAGALYGGA